MSSLTSGASAGSNGDSQADQTSPNTLRKDPPSRNQPVPAPPAGNKSKLIKPRAGATESDPAVDSTQQTGSVSRTNRLRKALGVGSSTHPDFSSQSNEPAPRLPSSSNQPSSRKPSERRTSPATSPTTAKPSLPSTSESTSQQQQPQRPEALRSQSYSKRHASFDTPREVPMPAMPFGASSIDPIALDDGDMDRNEAAAAAGWVFDQMQTPRQPERWPTGRKVSAATPPPPGSENGMRESMHLNLTPAQAPQFSRNNSAPTPPHTPAAERMDLRYPQTNEKSTPDSGTSSAQCGSGSEQYTAQASTSGEVGSYLDAGDSAIDSSAESPDGKDTHARGCMDVVFKEGRLSTASLPLPRSYGAERVSRLPPPVRPIQQVKNASSSGSGSDGDQQSKTPTNFAEAPSSNLQESASSTTSFRNPSSSGGPYRTSYPFAGTFSREVPLVPGQRGSSLVADIEKNTQAGTAWRYSGPSMRRDYSEDDSEEKSAITRGQVPKKPEIEAPQAPLHPFLSAPTLVTPTYTTTRAYFGPSSTAATPGHDRTSPGLSAGVAFSETVGTISTSPAPSADRTSTASGSSGASSDLATLPERLTSELERRAPSSSVQQSQQQTPSSGADVNWRSRTTAEQGLADRPSDANAGPTMTVDTTPSAYILEATLPGYQRDEITLSTRKKRILHVVADGFVSGGGHFERRVSFGYDADMSRVRAEFNGSTLRITVPRRPTPQTFAASLGASATVGGGSSSGVGGASMFWRGRSNML